MAYLGAATPFVQVIHILGNQENLSRELALQSGQGLICNNVLHTRSGFETDSPRLLYRARYFDRIADT